jgi:hypothetical protein
MTSPTLHNIIALRTVDSDLPECGDGKLIYNLVDIEDGVLCLRCAIRANDADTAMFWASVLVASHQSYRLMMEFLASASEDIGLVDNSCLVNMVKAWEQYIRLCVTVREEHMTGWVKRVRDVEGMRVLAYRAVRMLCRAPKSNVCKQIAEKILSNTNDIPKEFMKGDPVVRMAVVCKEKSLFRSMWTAALVLRLCKPSDIWQALKTYGQGAPLVQTAMIAYGVLCGSGVGTRGLATIAQAAGDATPGVCFPYVPTALFSWPDTYDENDELREATTVYKLLTALSDLKNLPVVPEYAVDQIIKRHAHKRRPCDFRAADLPNQPLAKRVCIK